MARLKFISGAITGKLGEFVGSRWKGINYLKTYSKPSNPNTAKQSAVRKVFKAISLFATALFTNKMLDFVPPASRMTERNSVFRANKAMFTDKTFVPSALQVAKATLQAVFDTITCVFKASDMSFTFKGTVNIPESGNCTGIKAHLLVYDFVKGVSCFAFSQNVVPTNNIFTLNVTHWSPDDFNTTTGSKIADCRFYLFLSGLDRNDKKVISSTFSVPVAV